MLGKDFIFILFFKQVKKSRLMSRKDCTYSEPTSGILFLEWGLIQIPGVPPGAQDRLRPVLTAVRGSPDRCDL